MNPVHRRENGRIAWAATLRYVTALAVPLWDGDSSSCPVSGRALTPAERRIVARRQLAEREAVVVQ